MSSLMQRRAPWQRCLKILLLVSSLGSRPVQGVLQTMVLNLGMENGDSYEMLLSQAFFGEIPSMEANKSPALQLVKPFPADNDGHFLCEVVKRKKFPSNSMVMIPRGNCTFEQKVLNAQKMGAGAVLIFGALEGRYKLNTTSAQKRSVSVANVVYPTDKHDYDCDYGRAQIPSASMDFHPLPYNAIKNNPLLSGNTSKNLCMARAEDGLKNCPSKACLLTGQATRSTMEACCAWDLPIWLYADDSLKDEEVTIPSAYATMEQADELLGYLSSRSLKNVKLYQRWRPSWNLSYGLIWALGVFVAALASYLTADDYRKLAAKARRAQNREQGSAPSSQPREPAHRPSTHPDETLELEPIHALLFIVMASTTLFVLFYFKIYGVVKIMYALGCSNAVAQIILQPLSKRIRAVGKIKDEIFWSSGIEDIGDIYYSDFIAFAMAYVLGFSWLIMSYVDHDAASKPFFWIMQDIFGTCMCILFLKIIRLNSIEVASLLLVVAFFYDIFFVFITPLLFKKSIMITVATSGGPPKADPAWCEKYPGDPDCQGGNPLPMLLAIPRVSDYQGGSSLLGLGDIVLPGLLLSFGARFDAAKILVGTMGGGSGRLPSTCPEQDSVCGHKILSGYFSPLVIAYAVGLLMANSAVYLMETGQPALLYLVPCCLGTLAYIGWRKGELNELWNGPRAIAAADAILFGRDMSDINHAPLPSGEDDEFVAPPSAIDDDCDDGVALTETN